MEKILVSPGYRRELTWRFRVGLLVLVGFFAARVYVRGLLGLELHWAPLGAIFSPPSRAGAANAVVLVESLNYAYAFAFVLWLRDGLVLSADWVGLRLREARRERSRDTLRSPRARVARTGA